MNPLNHVAIIMDGNGRWGLKYKNSRKVKSADTNHQRRGNATPVSQQQGKKLCF